MLTSLSISNYALINKLELDFSKGLTIITGETGAGKSILLGALSMVLGNRADAGVLKDVGSNAVVEACFSLPPAGDGFFSLEELRTQFEQAEVDFDAELVLRRVISPNGKSRAFVNDNPVSLSFMKTVCSRLIDIHSQHENLLLGDGDYSLKLVDAFAGTATLAKEYRGVHKETLAAQAQVDALQTQVVQQSQAQDYLAFQYNQLRDAALEEGQQVALEAELQQLEHADEIQQTLFQILQLVEDGEQPVLTQLKEAVKLAHTGATKLDVFQSLADRMEQMRIELKDVAQDCLNYTQKIQVDPQRLEVVQQRLTTLYDLERKHQVDSDDALIALRDSLAAQFQNLDQLQAQLEEAQKKANVLQRSRDALADQWHNARQACVADLSAQLKLLLAQLGMPDAQLSFQLERTDRYGDYGNTHAELCFSANKDMPPREIGKVASGGELSRLMLCVKSIMARNVGLSTLIFDEVDAGVSGKIADCMGNMIYDLSQHLQVLAITHLPQVAAKGTAHFLVSKESNGTSVSTQVRLLSKEDHIMEIARMMSGSQITQAAIQHATELTNH